MQTLAQIPMQYKRTAVERNVKSVNEIKILSPNRFV